MFDFDFDIDWKSVAIGAGAVVAVAGAAYGISKLCEDDDDDEGSSRGGESSLPKQKSPVEILLDVASMNEIIDSWMPFEMIEAVAEKYSFKLPDHIGRTTGIMIIFNSNNDEMIESVIEEFKKWKESNEVNSSSTKEDLDLMDEIIDSNMPASLIKEAANKVNIVFTSDICRKEMIRALFLSGEDGIASIRSQYEKWKNKEFSNKKENDSDSKTDENKSEESK